MARWNSAQWLVDGNVSEGRGDNVAIRCQGRSTTYRQLQGQLWRTQAFLDRLGLVEGDRVAMVVVDDETFPQFFLGAQRSGLVAVPLSTMLEPTTLGQIVADSEASVLVVSAPFVATLPELLALAPGVEHVVVAGDIGPGAVPEIGPTVHPWPPTGPADGEGERPVASTTAGSPAFWLYSSGTTGQPKGVMHRHGNLRATVDTYASEILRIEEGDRFLSIAKLFFAYGLGNSLTFPFAVGATAILEPDPPTPAAIVDLIETERPTLFFASPGFVAALLDLDPDPAAFASIRATVTAGESLPANIQTRFAALTSRPVLDGIGSTELLHIFISNTIEAQTPGSSGQVVPGYRAELRDDDDRVVTEAGTPGYLHVQGPSAATGYWRRDEATAAAFRGSWVRTGDVYTRSEDDRWTFLGRNNDMIKAGGIWVSPAEVESALIEHPDVMEAAVVGARDGDGLETTVAFVLPSSGRTPDPEALIDHCRQRMAAFKRPRRVVVVDELPKTATGKIKRFQLRDSLSDEEIS